MAGNGGEKISKEEMARRISGSVSARSNDEIRTREEARNRGDEYSKYADRRVYNPYLGEKDSADRPAKKSAGKNGVKGSKSKNKKKNKRRQRRKRIIAAVLTLVVLIGAAGAGGAVWYIHGKAKYDGVFLDNTYINGTDVSGKTIEEAAELVKQDSDMPDVITLTKPDGNDVSIRLDDIGGEDNITTNVKNFYSNQNHANWFKAKTQDTTFSFSLKFQYDRDEFYKEVKRKIVDGQKATEPENAYIERTDSGFQIVDEVVGNEIDEDKVQLLYDYIDGFLDRGEYSINLKNCNCYTQPEVTASDLSEQLSTLNALYDVEFEFDFNYTTEVLKGSTVIDWITFETDNPLDGYTVDESKVESYVEELADKYDTYGKDRIFNSTSRGEITVEQGSGDYGWWIDKDKTEALIIDLIKDGVSGKVEPYYYTNPDTEYSYTCDATVWTAASDIGDTYCEVDLKEQHFWYYKDGKLEYECDIVSGKPTEARNTPGGVYKLWYKELNKVLSGTTSEGESWSTPVTYWNNISTFGVGLHDATWQTSFGGTRYVDYGSHGCINMPYEAAEYVYENIEMGTPVVMYW